MEKIFTELIQEWHTTEIPPFTPRENTDYLHETFANVYAIIGPRRAGKTYFLYQIMQHLIDTKQCEKKDFLFIDFEDVRLQGMSAVTGLNLLKAYYTLYGKEPKFLIFDEIQHIPDWSRFLRTLHNKRYKIIITGSSSKLLLTEISTELRGRYTHTMILPFSFKEYLAHQVIIPQEIEYTSKSGLIYGAFDRYLEYGGFPALIDLSNTQKIKQLMEYYNTIYYRDIIDRYIIRDRKLSSGFMQYLLNVYSSLLSLGKLEKYFKNEELKGTKSTFSKYLSYFKEAFFTIECNKFGYSPKDQFINPKKVYLIDQGFIKLGTTYSEDLGKKLENLVAIELFRREQEFYYFHDKKECDFVVKNPMALHIQQAIQVTRELNFASQEREISGLVTAMEKCHLSQGYILTYNQKKEIQEADFKIHVLPVWEWLISGE